jgi:hypothetical protein
MATMQDKVSELEVRGHGKLDYLASAVFSGTID